jgi:molybdenum cofactor biosynthesis protein B
MSGLRVAVVTVSDTRTPDTDTSGRLVKDSLAAAGHTVFGPEIVRDEIGEIRSAFERGIHAADLDVIISTGGTGITARDVTPEALAPLISKPIPGFGELFRWLSYAEVGAATIQSRAEAGLCGRVLVFALPGSPGAVRLALEKILIPQLDLRTRPCNFAELLPRIRG